MQNGIQLEFYFPKFRSFCMPGVQYRILQSIVHEPYKGNSMPIPMNFSNLKKYKKST